MDDLYIEQLVARKHRPTDSLIRGLVIGLTVLSVLLGLFVFPIFLAAAAAGGLAIYFLLPNLSVEFEYLYVSKTLQIDKILSKEKRKKVVEYELEKMEIFAEEGAWQLDDHKNIKAVERDFTSGNEGAARWIMIVHNGNQIDRVALEPGEDLINAVRTHFPRKTFRKN